MTKFKTKLIAFDIRTVAEGTIPSAESLIEELAALEPSDAPARQRLVDALRIFGFPLVKQLLNRKLETQDLRDIYAVLKSRQLREKHDSKIARKEFEAALIGMLEDSSPEVREAAAVAIHKLDVHDALPQLKTQLYETRTVGMGKALAAMARAIGEFGTMSQLARLAPIIDRESEDSDVVIAAANAIKQIAIRDTSGVSPRLTAMLTHERNWQVRLAAVEGIGEIGLEIGLTNLYSRLDDDVLDVQQAAIEAMGKIGSGDALPTLEATLRRPSMTPDEVRYACAKAIVKIKCKTDSQTINRILRSETNLYLLLAALEETKANAGVDLSLVKSHLPHDVPAVRKSAVGAVGRIGSAADVDVLLIRLSEEDAEIQAQAALSLTILLSNVRSEDRIALLSPHQTTLLEKLDDENRDVRLHVGLLIATTWEEAFFQELVDKLASGNPRARGIAANTINMLKHPDYLPHLLTRFEEETDEEVKKALIAAIASLGDRANIGTLLGALHDGQWEVGQAAAAAIAKLATTHETVMLRQMLGDQKFYVYQAAAKALGKLPGNFPELLTLLESNNPVVREAMAGALLEIGSRENQLTSTIAQLLQVRQPEIISAIAEHFVKQEEAPAGDQENA
ncbi:MAG: HEAT repeat domain-containing protein [Candidatus Saganbacteria bacterium]|nr:HEAT repeat domain-containing protein [Candidatus Saganbacteria bacterium]